MFITFICHPETLVCGEVHKIQFPTIIHEYIAEQTAFIAGESLSTIQHFKHNIYNCSQNHEVLDLHIYTYYKYPAIVGLAY